jgi:hypothetical protein
MHSMEDEDHAPAMSKTGRRQHQPIEAAMPAARQTCITRKGSQHNGNISGSIQCGRAYAYTQK